VFHNVINSELVSTPTTRHSINPANRQPNPEVPVSTEDDLDKAVTAAQAAFKEWRKVPLEERRAALAKYADALEAEKDGFTKLLTQEQGKPLSQAAFEIGVTVDAIRVVSTLELPETVLEDTPERKIVQRFTPLGVAAAIVPWNFPCLLAMGKIVSALITGNSVIVKPSPYTPYCNLKLAELAIPFFPKGLFQALSGDDSLGPLVTAHPGIHKISFTGSTATGRLVAATCGKTLKHCTLELGGNDATIVTEDVDVDQVVQKVRLPSHPRIVVD
jgi:acyl-CoA reductase-like NAD-dependent aldehyde dehydrogenase